jgi:hypothetical protein
MKSVILNLSLIFSAQSAMAINAICTDPAPSCQRLPNRENQQVSASIVGSTNVTLGHLDPSFYLAFGSVIVEKMYKSNGSDIFRKTEQVSETDWDGTKVKTYFECGFASPLLAGLDMTFACNVGAGSNVVYKPKSAEDDLDAYSAYLHLQGKKKNTDVDTLANLFINKLSTETAKGPGEDKLFRVESFSDESGTKYWLKSGLVGGAGADTAECFEAVDSTKSYCKLFIWTAIKGGQVIQFVD